MRIIENIKLAVANKLINSLTKGGYDSIFLKNRDYLLTDDNVTQKPYSKNDLAYVCITTTQRAIAPVPMVVEKWVTKDIYEPMPANNPWMKLISRPNYLLDDYRFKESLIGHLLLDGHIFAIKFPPQGKIPDYLQIVPKKYMKKNVDSQNGRLLGWDYRPNLTQNKPIPIYLDELASIWLWNPDDPYEGLAPIEAAKIGLQTDFKAGKWNQNFFDNDATPGGTLSTDKKLLPKTIENLREQFESRHQGFNRSRRLAVLDQGLKYQITSLSHKDMDFLDLRKFTHKCIMRVLGMKPGVLDSEGLNYAVSKQERKEWWMGTNLPIMKLVSSALSFALFGPTQEYRVRFKTETIAALQEDHLVQARTSHYFHRQGVPFNLINRRLELGFPDIPGGDIGYLPKGLVPVNQLTANGNIAPIEEGHKYTAINDNFINGQIDIDKTHEEEWIKYTQGCAPLIKNLEKKLTLALFNLRSEILKNISGSNKDFSGKYNKITEYLNKNVPQILEGIPSAILNINELSHDIALPRYDLIFFKNVINAINHLLINNKEGQVETIKEIFNIFAKKAKQIAHFQIMSIANYLRNLEITHCCDSKIWFTPVNERCTEHGELHNKEIGVYIDFWLIGKNGLRFPCDPNADPKQTIGCNCIEIGLI